MWVAKLIKEDWPIILAQYIHIIIKISMRRSSFTMCLTAFGEEIAQVQCSMLQLLGWPASRAAYSTYPACSVSTTELWTNYVNIQ